MMGSRTYDTAVGLASDPLRVMQRIVDEVLILVESADGAAVELADAAGMTYAACAGGLAGFVGVRLSLDASLSGLAVRTQAVMHCEDSETDPRVDQEACQRVGARSMLCLPLLRASTAVGVLKVSSATPSAFTPRDIVTLRRLGEFVTFVIDTAAGLSKAIDSAMPSTLPPGEIDDDGVARFVARVLVPAAATEAQARDRIQQVIDAGAFLPVFQPIVELNSGEVVGAEALTRFTATPKQSTDRWFLDAHAVGLGVDLECAAAAAALRYLPRLPYAWNLAINLSPATIGAPAVDALLDREDTSRITIEVTENAAVDDYPELRRRLAAQRRRGARLAVDDTGAGFASFAHIIQLAPDVIKLDLRLTQGVDIDPVRRSLTTALVAFAADTGAEIVAEGIETGGELRTLQDLGISHGQGYLLGRPMPFDEFLVMFGTRGVGLL